MSSKIISQIFKILFYTEDINIFVLPGVFLSRYVQMKIYFSNEKTSAMKPETQFTREVIENLRGRVSKENSITGGS